MKIEIGIVSPEGELEAVLPGCRSVITTSRIGATTTRTRRIKSPRAAKGVDRKNRAKRLFIPNPRVYESVEEVGGEIDQHVAQGDY